MDKDLVAIFICVVLPIAVVLITALTKMNADNKRTQVIIKAIEANNDIDADKLADSLKKTQRTPLELLNLRLLRGCIFSFVGLALAIVGVVNLANGALASSDPVTVPLMFGGASLAIGLSYVVVYFVTRKQINR